MTPPHNKTTNQKKKECNFYFILKKANRDNEGMDAPTVDRAVPVRSKQIKKEVQLEIRPQTRSKTTRDEGREEEEQDERQEATASRSPLVTMTVR
jgi:hypothetical protein